MQNVKPMERDLDLQQAKHEETSREFALLPFRSFTSHKLLAYACFGRRAMHFSNGFVSNEDVCFAYIPIGCFNCLCH